MDESWKRTGVQKILKKKVMAYNKAAFNIHNNKSKFTAGYEKNKKAMSKLAPFLLSTQPEEVYQKQQPYEKPLYLKMRRRPKDYFDESIMWLGKEYVLNNFTKRNLAIGDLVFLHPAPNSSISTLVCVVWYLKMDDTYVDAPRYSLIIKTLEGRESGRTHFWDDFRLDYLHVHDEWLNDITFVRLEPIQWWIGKNATTKSSEFKAMAAVLGIHESIYKDLP